MPPKDINLDALSGSARLPSRAECWEVFGLRHLVHAIEMHLCRVDWILSTVRDFKVESDYPEPENRLPEWAQGVHRSIYLSFILGAALAGVYREPLFEARHAADLELRDTWKSDTLTAKQLSFMMQYTVCKTQTDLGPERDVFHNISQWLLRTILSDDAAKESYKIRWEQYFGRGVRPSWRAPSCALHLEGHRHSTVHLVAWRVMQTLCAQTWLSRLFTRRHASGALHCRNGAVAGPAAEVVLFGDFTVEAFGAAPCLSRDADPGIVAQPVVGARGQPRDPLGRDAAARPYVPSETRGLFDWLGDRSGQPNFLASADGDVRRAHMRTPPLLLKFFSYMLRQLGVRFRDAVFLDTYDPSVRSFADFVQAWGVFALDDDPSRVIYNDGLTYEQADVVDGSELFVEYTPLPDLVFKEPVM